jgi:hypothetical protein
MAYRMGQPAYDRVEHRLSMTVHSNDIGFSTTLTFQTAPTFGH